MKERCNFSAYREFLAARNRFVVSYGSCGFASFLATYLTLTANALSRDEGPELDCLRRNIAQLSETPDEPISNELRAKLYPFIREAVSVAKLTRHTTLNRIIELEIALLDEKLKEAQAIVPTSYSIVNSADEFGAMDAIRSAEYSLRYLAGVVDFESYRVYRSQIETVGEALRNAIRSGFPSETASIYWLAIEPKLNPESKKSDYSSCAAIERLYATNSDLLKSTISECAITAKPTTDSALSMLLFVNARINWMRSGLYGISEAGKAISAPELKLLHRLVGTISCLLTNDVDIHNPDRFDSTQMLLNDAIEILNTL